MDHKYTFAAFDVGGTKTDAVLFDEHGNILNHIIDPGGAPIDVGVARSAEIYSSTLERLMSVSDGCADVFYGGIAGSNYCHGEVERLMRERFPQIGKMRIESDGPCLISGMSGHIDGASMICGTGSSLCVRHGDSYHHVGGWGHLIDSCGSGYVLARCALQRVLRAHDGRLSATLMSELVEQRLGAPAWDSIDSLYAGGRPYIASLASVVFEARRMGDAAAAEIFEYGARELAELAFTAYRELKKPFDLVLNGGIFTHFPEYTNAVIALCPGEANVFMSDVPPVYGCAVEALWDAGLEPDAEFKRRFLDGYNSFKK